VQGSVLESRCMRECARVGFRRQVYGGGRSVQGSVLESRCMREAGVCKGRFEEIGVCGRQEECARADLKRQVCSRGG
jgi:hypothetical protein